MFNFDNTKNCTSIRYLVSLKHIAQFPIIINAHASEFDEKRKNENKLMKSYNESQKSLRFSLIEHLSNVPGAGHTPPFEAAATHSQTRPMTFLPQKVEQSSPLEPDSRMEILMGLYQESRRTLYI